MTAGLGAAIALGQGAANASTGDESGESSASATTRGPESTDSDADTSADAESSTHTEDSTSEEDAEPTEPDETAVEADAPDSTEEEDADLVEVDLDEPELISIETAEPGDEDTEPEVPAPPVEALGLAVRTLQDRREITEVAPADISDSRPVGESKPLSAVSTTVGVTAAAVEPPNWFTTTVNNIWNTAKTVTRAAVDTVKRVVDGVVKTAVVVVNGVTQFLFGERIPVQNPTNTPGHWQRLQTVTGGFLNDGFHIDKIRSAYDGVERLVVYLGGTTLGLNQAAILNGPAWAGDPKPWQILQLGMATQNNPDIEILMFGYSQGGMDAQNLVAKTDFNIKMVVTFGSPIVQDPPDFRDVWMLHLQAKKDPVIDWGRPGLLEKARKAEIVYQTTTKTGEKPLADWFGLFEVHGDPATYREVAQKMETEYVSDTNMDYWEGQYIRTY